MRLLIVYGSTEGHTEKIAVHMAGVARAEGCEVNVVDSAHAESLLEPDAFDAVIVGGSVHQGQHQSSLRAFVLANTALLERLPSAFFSVSLSAAVPDAMHQQEARGYVETFLNEMDWQPRATACFAGALRYAEYDYFRRLVLRVLAGQLGPGVVRGEDAVYTDWAAVEQFVRGFLESVRTSEKPVADSTKG